MAGQITIRSLICEGGLGYCCPWFFFRRFGRTAVIADRLGVSDRAVRVAKARVAEGLDVCEHRENCLHRRVTFEGNPRQSPASFRFRALVVAPAPSVPDVADAEEGVQLPRDGG